MVHLGSYGESTGWVGMVGVGGYESPLPAGLQDEHSAPAPNVSVAVEKMLMASLIA